MPLTLTIPIKLFHEGQLQEHLSTWDTQQIYINSMLRWNVDVKRERQLKLNIKTLVEIKIIKVFDL